MKSKVYFSKTISPEKVLELYKLLGIKLEGNVAMKVHSGEEGNQNFLRPEFWKQIVDYVGGTIVECNTAYKGPRFTSEAHHKLMDQHDWTKYFKVDILDEDKPDLVLEIPNGSTIKKDIVGSRITNYDSMLVLSHFKGHPMGGYGGALKQLSIGCASSVGKGYIHTAGASEDLTNLWKHVAPQEKFLSSMADAASAVYKYFEGNIAFINVMANLSVDCDCISEAEDPCMKDIGILASLDPIAIDQACIDLVYAAKDDPGQKHFLERVESRKGILTIEQAAKLGFGSREYELIEIE